MAFLAQAGLALDRSLDLEGTLRELAELTVPELAQLAVVDLLENERLVRTSVAVAPDPAQARALEEMRREHPLRLDGPHPVAEVLRTGTSVLYKSMSPGFQRKIAEGPEHYTLMRKIGYHSAIVVPLIARERVLGALSLLRMQDAEPYDDDDLVLAEELARRAALAIDNARMFAVTRDLAQTLQASLLPRELPVIPGVQVTGRYRAAAQGQEVGGDFYDLFMIGEGYWGIAIGDVCGKGPEAAALTALARYTLRALAGRDPGIVLSMLNDMVFRDPALLPEQFVTVLFAVAMESDRGLSVDVSSAGHPAPLVLRADGMVERVPANGPLVGLVPDSEYRPAPVSLGPGDSLVLYTDGLTDARAPAHTVSDDELAKLVAQGHGLGGERLAAFLEGAATGGEDPRDDIAILVVEVAPEDG
jgi:serine phosphatase RsbU (regulator of sigma subunit)